MKIKLKLFNNLLSSKNKNHIKYTFDIQKGLLIRLGENIYEEKSIGDVGISIKSSFRINKEKLSLLYKGKFYLGGQVLNKFIINHLVYGIKPDILETKNITYRKTQYGELVEEKNTQYDEYLKFVHS